MLKTSEWVILFNFFAKRLNKNICSICNMLIYKTVETVIKDIALAGGPWRRFEHFSTSNR